MDQLLDIVD